MHSCSKSKILQNIAKLPIVTQMAVCTCYHVATSVVNKDDVGGGGEVAFDLASK